MNAPICDFVKSYAQKDGVRLHMPGHKGKTVLGFEKFDITEISGADELFFPEGVIKESRKNASKIFGAETFYSVEGSTSAVKAMLFLAVTMKENSLSKKVAAFRNAHKSFLDAAALIGFDIDWIYPESKTSDIASIATPKVLREYFSHVKEKPCAVYLTSPDYLGNISDIKSLSEICKEHGVLLLVDAAHGAYLKFLRPSLYPTDLGADMCCSSAHKTLPAVTGAAYLHISDNCGERFVSRANFALSLFCSTSPSYITLQSLDYLNIILSNDFYKKLNITAKKVQNIKEVFALKGFTVLGQEPLKITVSPLALGYTGHDFAKYLRKNDIECEFCDENFTTLMFSPCNKENDFIKLKKILSVIPAKPAITVCSPEIPKLKTELSVRDATFSQSEKIPVQNAVDKILSHYRLSCPPAIPIAVPGELITKEAIKCFIYYGIKEIYTVK